MEETNLELFAVENPVCSTDDVWRDDDMERCLSDDLDAIEANIAALQSGKADVNHTHDGYASQSDLDVLEDAISTKANATHSHSEYASSSHSHDDYATVIALDTLESELDGKANASHTHTEYSPIAHSHSEYAEISHSHSNYSETTHTHDDYASITHTHTASEIGAAVSGHNHDDDYAVINHNHDSAYATIGHDHDEDYAAVNHSHTDYATTTALSEVSSIVSGKANASHSHDDMYYTETEIDTKLSAKADASHTHTGVYDASGAAASALTSANAYTDSKIDALVGEGASTTLDTIGEISSAIEDNQDAIDLLNAAIANKANTTDLNSHANDTEIHTSENEKNNWNIAYAHSQVAHAPSNAEANQNAFSNIVVNSTTLSADTTTDTLTLVAGSNVTLTPSAENDSVTISATNTVYTHPTTAGNKHIPAGGSSGQILRWSADGTAVWGADNNTTYSVATQTSNGLMSANDKGKLDSIAEGANNYTLPSAGTALGGVKTGGDVTISSGVITVNDDSHNHVISNVDGLQSALDAKAASSHSHDDVYYTETEMDTLLSGKANSSHTHTIANITNLQTTLDGKAASGHTHSAATTSAAGFMSASDKAKLDGIASGANAYTLPTASSSTLGGVKTTSTVTSNSGYTACPIISGVPYYKDTNTTYSLSSFGVTATAAELNALDGITATVTELNYVDGVTSNIQTQLNAKASSSHTHSYAGSSSAGGAATSANKLNTNAGSATQPVYFANGVPVATTYTLGKSVPSNAVFTDTTYSVATTSANGLMSASDKSKLDGMVLATVSEVETYLAI